jgi:hypothetical protein
MALPGHKGSRVYRDLKAIREQPDLRESRVFRDLLDLRDRKDHRELPGPGSTIKECG